MALLHSQLHGKYACTEHIVMWQIVCQHIKKTKNIEITYLRSLFTFGCFFLFFIVYSLATFKFYVWKMTEPLILLSRRSSLLSCHKRVSSHDRSKQLQRSGKKSKTKSMKHVRKKINKQANCFRHSKTNILSVRIAESKHTKTIWYFFYKMGRLKVRYSLQ